eukprot:2730527-Pyramimonas_sp.AAC.1
MLRQVAGIGERLAGLEAGTMFNAFAAQLMAIQSQEAAEQARVCALEDKLSTQVSPSPPPSLRPIKTVRYGPNRLFERRVVNRFSGVLRGRPLQVAFRTTACGSSPTHLPQ